MTRSTTPKASVSQEVIALRRLRRDRMELSDWKTEESLLNLELYGFD